MPIPIVLALGAAASNVQAQNGFLGWVGLYDPDALGRLENENRWPELCPQDADDFARCHAAAMAPSVSVYPLHREPDAASPRVGDLIVLTVPGRGLSAHYHAAGANEVVHFVPDLYLGDWFYGPYFHQTVVERRGDWFRLPRGPWPSAVWLRRDSDRDTPTTMFVLPGDILEMDGTGWFVVAAEEDALLLRAEQTADMWCEGLDPPPPLEPDEPTRYRRAELLDAEGHLTISPKYMKGC